QNGAGPLLVPAHLGDERVQRVELQLIPNALDELDLRLPPIEVAVEIEEMNLEQRRGGVDRRPRAGAGGRRKGGALYPAHNRINPMREPVGRLKRDIRRRNAKGAAQALARNHLAGDGIIAAETFRHGGKVPVLKGFSNDARGDDAGAVLDLVDDLDAEAM